jgi:hypothetical protein
MHDLINSQYGKVLYYSLLYDCGWCSGYKHFITHGVNHIKLFGENLLNLFCNITACYSTADDAMDITLFVILQLITRLWMTDIRHFITHGVNLIKLFGVNLLNRFCNITAYYTTVDDATDLNIL